jgi:hypothetical protein
MDRRAFVSTVALGLLAAPLAAGAQPAGKLPRIGALSPSAPEKSHCTVAYGAALALHAVTVLVSWRQLLHPWADPVNHLFIASIPVLGGLIALFLLRHWDRPAFKR